MLTIRVCKAYSRALGEYLRQGDYYTKGMKLEGHCHGQLCPVIGLTAGKAISDDAFERAAANRNALTNEQLTERMAAGRRAGYDAVFNAPKSVSIQAFVGGDERLIAAHEIAVQEALAELERYARYQTGRGLNKRHVAAGGIAAAVFRHGESRALDPHLHSHAFIFNATRDAKGRLMALESSAIFKNARYLSEVYRNVLAREVRQLGYGIERQTNGFELTGVPAELLLRFSKRAQERDAAIKTREAELGRESSRDEIAILVRENRAAKQNELTPAEVRHRQLAQVTSEELEALRALKGASANDSPQKVPLPDVIAHATEHVFERKTVVSEEEFFGVVLRESYGAHSLSEVKAAVAGDSLLLSAGGKVSTQAALDLERGLVARLNAGVGALDGGLGFVAHDEATHLSREQRRAMETVLASCDRVTVLRGRAGTGKTQTLATVIDGATRFGGQAACFAPSTQAVEILRQDGNSLRAGSGASLAQSRAETVQRLLVDSALQQSLRHQVIVVDEYGLLSTRQLNELVQIAEKQSARLLLVGDSAQHKSVEAGDAARIIEKESRAKVVTLSEVHRQAANPAYRKAVEDLAAGRFDAGLRKLDRMGSIIEVSSPISRTERMVNEWFEATSETKQVRMLGTVQQRAKTALMVAPTWSEIDQLNLAARYRLRAEKKLAGPDQEFVSLRAKDWTRAQQKDHRNYRPGDILVAHKATKHFAKGDELRVLRREHGRLIVSQGTIEMSLSPRQSGLVWTVCEERSNPVAAGDRLRLRSVALAELPSGEKRRLANGTVVTVQSVNRSGQLVLSGGAILRSRQVAYSYALTSHASQGTTVDKVFLAGATSREGLYVAATRGRESLRIFVPDREAFLDTAGLRSEARTSALEFTRAFRPDLRSHLARAWSYIQQVRLQVTAYLAGNPDASFLPPPEIHCIPVRAAKSPGWRGGSEDVSPCHHESETPRHGMRMGL